MTISRLNGKGMAPAIDPSESYAVDMRHTTPCSGDLIQFKGADGRSYVRRVIGVAGQTLSLTASGYTIGGQSSAMS